MTKPGDDPQEVTRSTLARTVLWLLALLATVMMVVIGFQRQLGLSAEGIKTLWGIFGAVMALAMISFTFYFPRRR